MQRTILILICLAAINLGAKAFTFTNYNQPYEQQVGPSYNTTTWNQSQYTPQQYYYPRTTNWPVNRSWYNGYNSTNPYPYNNYNNYNYNPYGWGYNNYAANTARNLGRSLIYSMFRGY